MIIEEADGGQGAEMLAVLLQRKVALCPRSPAYFTVLYLLLQLEYMNQQEIKPLTQSQELSTAYDLSSLNASDAAPIEIQSITDILTCLTVNMVEGEERVQRTRVLVSKPPMTPLTISTTAEDANLTSTPLVGMSTKVV
jgi:hypothetical protein